MVLCLSFDQNNNLIGTQMGNASSCTGYIVESTASGMSAVEANQLIGAAIGALALAWVFRFLIKSMGVL